MPRATRTSSRTARQSRTPDGAQAAAPWRSRIVGHADVEPRELTANPLNWRKHPAQQIRVLEEILDRIGWVQDIVVNRRSGHVVDGHLRVERALDRGEATVPVVYVDLDDEEEALALATLDPIAALAGADSAVLSGLLATVSDAGVAVQELLDGLATSAGISIATAGLTDPDDAPPLRPDPVTQPGDLWLLGDHRLLCGDSSRSADVARVMAGDQAVWLRTDPPYGVDYHGGTAESLTISNDRDITVTPLLKETFTALNSVLAVGCAIYVAHPAGPIAAEFMSAFAAAGWHLHQTLVWVKDRFVLGHSDYHYRHESVLYGWKGTGRPWLAGRDQDSVFELPRPQRSIDHPTMKPVALVARMLANSSATHAIGIDPFTGSGTTLIAAEQLSRRARGIEVEPRYVDSTVRRWQSFTGSAAVLDGDGRTFDEIEEAGRAR